MVIGVDNVLLNCFEIVFWLNVLNEDSINIRIKIIFFIEFLLFICRMGIKILM